MTSHCQWRKEALLRPGCGSHAEQPALKQAVRMIIAFFVGATSGKRGPLAAFEVTLDSLALPEALAGDILEARQLAIDVAERIEKVDGQGSADDIDSVRALVKRLVEWGAGEITRKPNLADQTGQWAT